MESKDGPPVSSKPGFVRKGPQELAAQMTKVYGVYLRDNLIPNAEQLQEQYKEWRKEVQDLLDNRVGDQTLATALDRMHSEGVKMGLYKATVGDNNQQTRQNAKDYYGQWKHLGDTLEEEIEEALGKQGYVTELRREKKQEHGEFKDALDKFIKAHPTDGDVEKKRLDELRGKVVDLDQLSEDDIARLKAEFVGGNFIYHGAKTNEVLGILQDGSIVNYKFLWEREEQRAKAEGRKKDIPKRNSGYEGISWSMNAIDALPGDRYHIAGFIGSPARILQGDQQFAVPSRPAPFEVIQIDRSIDANTFYELKTQAELLEHFAPFGEAPSVLGNLLAAKSELDARAKEAETGQPEKRFWDEPQLHFFARTHTDEEIDEIVHKHYSLGPDGAIQISPELVQQYGDPLPPAAMWFQALIDTGRINNMPDFKGASTVRQMIDRMTEENIMTQLAPQLKIDRKVVTQKIEEQEGNITDLSVDIENLYLVASRHDLPKWLKVLARCDRQPRGIITYDPFKVRLENWASPHVGHHSILTQELQKGIVPDSQAGYINWEDQILGEKLSDEKLGGAKRQVISENYLTHRRTITKDSEGRFVFSR